MHFLRHLPDESHKLLVTPTDPSETPTEVLDGYGVPFPPEAQERHLRHVLDAMRRHEEKQQAVTPVAVEAGDKVAGAHHKGEGV